MLIAVSTSLLPQKICSGDSLQVRLHASCHAMGPLRLNALLLVRRRDQPILLSQLPAVKSEFPFGKSFKVLNDLPHVTSFQSGPPS